MYFCRSLGRRYAKCRAEIASMMCIALGKETANSGPSFWYRFVTAGRRMIVFEVEMVQ